CPDPRDAAQAGRRSDPQRPRPRLARLRRSAGSGAMMKWHVFPQGSLCSIRRALMLWLVPVFLVVGATSAGLAYWSYCAMVSGFMDDQMVQIASAMAGSEEARLPRQTAERVEHWGGFVVQTYGAQGRLVATTYPELAAPLQQDTGFH